MKIGILTFYKGNHNYGGILQAYALQKHLEQLGHEAVDISLDYTNTKKLSKCRKLIKLFKMKGKAFSFILGKIKEKRISKETADIRKRVANGFVEFESSVPHTERMYRSDEMELLNDRFDVFICGSDQVWAPLSNEWYTFPHTRSYFLGFTDKKKISYAASFGILNIPESYLKSVIPYLEKFDALSVRESSVCTLLSQKLKRDVSTVVDPTLLFSGDQWIEMLGLGKTESDYVFSYILGESLDNRRETVTFAKRSGLPLRTVPYIGKYTKNDQSFGDVQLIGITPQDFLTQIYNASVVITDSFHCAVFSILFKKKFAVLKRTADNASNSMNGRLYDLLKSVGLEDRIVSPENMLDDVLDKRIPYDLVDLQLAKLVNLSKSWLNNALL